MNQPNHVAIVTGAASGIGLATAGLLAESGYSLVLAGRTERSLQAASASLPKRADTSPPLIVPCDMGKESDAAALVDRAIERFGRIDALVNNAGWGDLVPIGATTIATVRKSFDVNVIGPAAAILRAWPHFQGRGAGCVVNVSSIASFDPLPGFFAYAASKAAMNLLARSAAKEGAAIGVRAFSVAPGAVETPMLRGLLDEEAFPRDRCLAPSDVARLIVDCIEGRRDADNGRTISIVRKGDVPEIRVVADSIGE